MPGGVIMEPRTVSKTDKIVGGGRPYQDSAGTGPYVISADTLKGDEVVNAKGENLGEIKAIMLDVPGGRIAYAVLSFGGMLGIGEKLFAIPWNALMLVADEKRFILNLEQDVLMKAPGFDKDHWPQMADERWAADVHTYYSFPPYW
jgi:sporulation protein YlmC with PRC-barrel domain